MVYPATCDKCGEVEISSPMAKGLPRLHLGCGGALRRRYTVPAVTYAAAGFYSTDVTRLRDMVGPERYAKFEKQKSAAEKRAKAGTQTDYEKAMEGV